MNNNIIYNEYAFGCNKKSGACVILHGALQYHALNTQQSNIIHMAHTAPFSPFENLGVKYIYHPSGFLFDIEKHKDIDGNPIFVTGISQTIVDCIRHMDVAGGLEEILYAISSLRPGMINEKKMLKCLNAYDNASLWSRTGYLFSLFPEAGASASFLKECQAKGSGVKNILKYGHHPLEYNSKWTMMLPKNIYAIINEGIENHDTIF